jgi:hypothetical protein
MIKKYLEFIKESRQSTGFGCVMIDFNFGNWSDLLKSINKDDIYLEEGKNYGLQPRPHLTLLYGILPEVTDEQILKCFNGFVEDDFKVKINGVSVFDTNDDFDVVKLGVELTPKLKEINKRLSELPNSNQYPEYIPHITLSFIKKGTGKNYVNPEYKYEIKGIEKIIYSRPDGSEFKIEL